MLDGSSTRPACRKLEEMVPTNCCIATPHRSWERGSNHNVNGLLRQYAPKRTSMEDLPQARCQWIADKLNRRSRKRLGFRAPEEVYASHGSVLHFTGESHGRLRTAHRSVRGRDVA
jgi:IS30 family transposase